MEKFDKVCKDCGETKTACSVLEESDFHHNYQNGTLYYISYCRECKNARTRKHAKSARDKIREYKKEHHHTCSECGLVDWEVMQLHHHNDDKEKDPANCKSLSSYIKETSKCLVLCANCHQRLHTRERYSLT